MKVFNIVLRSALFVGFAFTCSSLSCDLFDKADDISFNVEVSHTFSIDASENDPLSYSDTQEYDLTTDPEFDQYKDKVTKIEIQSVNYTVQNYGGEPGITFSDGKGSFVGSGTSAEASAALAFQDIQASVGNEYTLDISTSGLDEISEVLKTLKQIQFQVSGNLSGVPVSFQVPVTIKMKVTADAL